MLRNAFEHFSTLGHISTTGIKPSKIFTKSTWNADKLCLLDIISMRLLSKLVIQVWLSEQFERILNALQRSTILQGRDVYCTQSPPGEVVVMLN